MEELTPERVVGRCVNFLSGGVGRHTTQIHTLYLYFVVVNRFGLADHSSRRRGNIVKFKVNTEREKHRGTTKKPVTLLRRSLIRIERTTIIGEGKM